MSVKRRGSERGMRLEELDSLHDDHGDRSLQVPVMRHSVSNPPPIVTDFIPCKKNRSIVKKKKVVSQKHYLPPMDVQAEKKLEDLQKLAAGSAALQHALATQHGIVSPELPSAGMMSKPLTSTMTGTEAEFLVRQINSADISQLSLLANTDEFESVANGFGMRNSGSSFSLNSGDVRSKQLEEQRGDPSQTINEALREKVVNLEKQLQTQTKLLHKREVELEKKDIKIRSTTQELQQLRLDAANDVKRLQSEHEVEIVRIREQTSKEKATLIRGEEDSKDGMNGLSPGRVSHIGGGQLEGNKRLMDQLDAVRLELRKAHQASADERRAMQIDFGQQLQACERKHKAELLELKSLAANLEDRLTQAREDVSASKADASSVRRLYEQADSLRLKAIDDQNKLRADLKNMQQSVQASYRLDTASTASNSFALGSSKASSLVHGGLPGDMESALKLAEAKSEAKVKQMANKVDFLKNQLDTEKKALEELKVAFQQSQAELGSIREDHERRLRDIEAQHAKDLTDVEEKVALNYERRMQELTTLQKQMLTLSAVQQQGEQERLVLAQRNDQLEHQTARNQAQQMACKAEADQLRVQLQALQQEREQDLRKDAGKLNQEAVLRRLDNERHYLKNQLSTEITLKNETQAALSKAQQQLSEIQQQWQADVATLKDAAAKSREEFDEREQRWQEADIQQQGELTRLKALNSDLKDGFLKMRDQLRMEQLSIETLQGERNLLREDLQRSTVDIAKARELEEQTLQQCKHQIDDMRLVLQDQEAHYLKEINRLKSELSRQFMDNSHVQADLLKSKRLFEQDKVQALRLIPAVRIFEGLRRWRTARLQRAFRSWMLTNTLQSVAKQFRAQVEKLVRSTKDENEVLRAKELEAQKRELTAQHELLIASYMTNANREAAQRIVELEDETRKQREALELQHRQLLQQAEEDFGYDLHAARQEAQEKLQTAQQQWLEQSEATLRSHAQEIELKRKEHLQVLAASIQQREMELAEEERMRADALRAEHQQDVKKLRIDFDVDMDHRLFFQKQSAEKELKQLHDRLLVEKDQALRAAQSGHAKTLLDLAQEHEEALLAMRVEAERERERALSTQRTQLHEEAEERIRQLRVVWSEEAEAQVGSALRAAEEDALRCLADRVRLKDEEKTKALKLEAAKWKQVVKDTENSMQLQMNKAKLEVAEALEKEFSAIQERLKISYDLQRDRDLELHREALKETERQHRQHMEEMQEQAAEELKAQQRAYEVQLRAKLEAEFEENSAALLVKQAAAQQVELDKEKARFSKLKDDFNNANAHYAEERSHLMSQIQSFDRKMDSLDNLKKVEIQQLQVAFEKERELLAAQQEERDKATMAALVRDKEQAVLAAVQEERTKQELVMAFEKDMLTRDHALQLQHAKGDMERRVADLEAELEVAVAHSKSISEQAVGQARALEDAEDNLYDASQKLKSAQKQLSLALWQAMTRIAAQKSRFAHSLEERDHAAKQEQAALRADLRLQYAQLVELVYRFVRYMQTIFGRHADMQNILTAYKVDEIRSVRKSIAAAEKDIEMVILEREACEEQRDQLVKDIEVLTGEVRNNEDELRALNSNAAGGNALSSTGTININLARKNKRINQEIERLYEQIEAKKQGIFEVDNTINSKLKGKEEKEGVLIEHERRLVGIILEQQKFVLKTLKELDNLNGGYRVDLQEFKLPSIAKDGSDLPSLQEVQAVLQRRWEDDDRAGK